MYMEWINRIGLFLDFLAGFLMAPEILGKRRLDMLAQQLERSFSEVAGTLREVEEIFRDWQKDPYHIPWPRRFPLLGRLINKRLRKQRYQASKLHIATSIFVAVVTFVLADKVFVGLLGANLAVDPFLRRYPVNFTVEHYVVYALMALGWTIFGTIASYAAEYWLLWFSRLVVAKLRGEDRLREILLALGILCFVVGFLLQIVATY